MGNRMKRYISTSPNEQSGESVEMIQLAKAMKAEIVHNAPRNGFLLYLINLNMRPGAENFQDLAERKYKQKGINAVLLGVGKGWEDADRLKPYFEVLKKISHIVFVHHPDQIDFLRHFGIEGVLKPISEERYTGPEKFNPNSVVYTGFLWGEKDIKKFIQVAQILPTWQFTIQDGKQTATKHNLNFNLPPNCTLNEDFIPQEEYLDYLAGFEYVWIPRTPSPWVYAARSGITAVASGRPAILTDVPPNAVVPNDVAIKYPFDWSEEQIARLIESRPQVDKDAVDSFLDTVDPRNVWSFMKAELEKRGLLDY